MSINNFKGLARKDEYFNVFSKNVTIKLRDLPKQQRLIAEKIINETLFEVEMDNLNSQHTLTSQYQNDHNYIRKIQLYLDTSSAYII